MKLYLISHQYEEDIPPNSLITALFTDLLWAPNVCLQNLRKETSVSLLGFICSPKTSEENIFGPFLANSFIALFNFPLQ